MSEPAAEGGDTSSPPGSISFVLVTETGVDRAGPVLDAIGAALRAGDEAILLTRSDRIVDLPSPAPPWLRVVGLPEASVFRLRGHVPAVARCEWIVLFEEHTFMTAAGVAAMRQMIGERRDIDLIVILGKNLTSVSPWGWANFLHTFARAWAPVDQPPPFAPVTSVALRRAALPGEAPLQDGEWELKVVPRLFATGRVGWAETRSISITTGRWNSPPASPSTSTTRARAVPSCAGWGCRRRPSSAKAGATWRTARSSWSRRWRRAGTSCRREPPGACAWSASPPTRPRPFAAHDRLRP